MRPREDRSHMPSQKFCSNKQMDKTAAAGSAGLKIVVATILAWGFSLFQSGPPSKGIFARTAMAETDAVPHTAKWEGPVLWYHKEAGPIELILVEKAAQELRLVRFESGAYKILNTFKCASGENQGKKRKQNDGKTPEGIYFNDKTFRDTQVTVFGDRAFGLNYPDVFDHLEKNGGNGIFIHGSNKNVAPYSTNGCVVLENGDLMELDPHIQAGETPVVIGERLPYLYEEASARWEEIVPFLEKALVPAEIANDIGSARLVCLIGYEDRVVALGRLFPKNNKNDMVTRIYMARASDSLLVMVKREWEEATVRRSKLARDEKTGPKPADGPSSDQNPTGEVQQIKQMIESWRQSWQAKDLNAYIAHYHGQFTGNGKGLKEWKSHKKALNDRYRKISIQVSDLKVTVAGTRAVITFVQKYRSDRHQSTGWKNMVLLKQSDSWKILKENTRPISAENRSS